MTEPIKLDWSQFGENWLRGMKSGPTTELGGGDDDVRNRKRNLAAVQRELEFWKENFTKLGHMRDAYEVNYQINTLGKEGVRLERFSIPWWEASLLSLPNRFGTSPYRPLIVGLLIIIIFAFIYRFTDPFVKADEKKEPRPKSPLIVFSLMYSIDTFIPVVDVTKVRDWGWEVSNSYRWLTVTERLLGLLVFYSATYALTYYIF